MKTIRILIAALLAVLGVTAVAQVTLATSGPSTNPNDASYWQARTEHPSVCYKHDPPNERTAHGGLSQDGKSVILKTFNQSWPGDHWELLVVKSGSVDTGNGAGNAVYTHPVAGTPYAGPLNNAGQQGAVSHWIVCKGTTPTPTPTSPTWTAVDGDCDAPAGTLTVAFDPNKVVYTGDGQGSYPAGTTVGGSFTAKSGFVISGNPGPFSHQFAVQGAPCEQPADLRLDLEPVCAVGDTLVWKVTNSHDVAIPFSFDGPGVSDGDGIAPAGGTTFFTTDGGESGETVISWTNPSGGPSSDSEDPNGSSCVYHVSFDKAWEGGDAPDLDGAVLLTAESSIGTASCTSDDGALTCTYLLGETPVDDLHVPDGETYDVTETVPSGWYTVSGTGTGFTGIEGFDAGSLPDALVPDVADDRFCTSYETEGRSVGDDTRCVHLVTNAPTDQAPAPQFVDPTCAEREVDIVDPVADDGITYEVVDGSAAPGQSVTVRAIPGEGIVLEGQTEWTHTFGEVSDADCTTPGTPSSDITPECGAATLTFTNSPGEIGLGQIAGDVTFSYTVDGETFQITVAPGATKTVELTFDEDSGVHTVVIGDGDPVLVNTDCLPEQVVPAAPTFVDPTCDTPADARVQLPSQAGVVFDVVGSPAPGATVTVNASAAAGYALSGTTTWNHTFAVAQDVVCNPPSVPPVTYESAGPTTTVASSGTSGTTTLVTELPKTGSNSTAPIVALAAGLLVAGLLIVGATRRRRPI